MNDRFPAKLTTFYDVEQGDDDWHDLRRGMVTASTIGALITPKTIVVSKAQAGLSRLTEIAAERITDMSEEPITSKDIRRGHFYEPYARDEYAKHYKVDVQEVGFMVRDVAGLKIGYSPDGLIGDAGLIEIKSRKPRIQVQTILDDAVPVDNMAQLQTGLFVSGREWIDYVSYSTGMPLYTKRVLPDPKWQKTIGDALKYAEEKIAVIVDSYQKLTESLPVTEYVEHIEDWEIELGGLSL